jgi:hypothetical protein
MEIPLAVTFLIGGILLVVFARPLGRWKKTSSDQLGFSSIPESGWTFLARALGGTVIGVALIIFLMVVLRK